MFHYKALVHSIALIMGICLPASALAQLNASTLPDARSVAVGDTASVFATMTNSFGFEMTQCEVVLGNNAPAGLSLIYQTTDPSTNALNGTPDTQFMIPAGGSQSLALFFTSTAEFSQSIAMKYRCSIEGRDQAPVFPGVNDVLLTVTDPGAGMTPPDIIVIGSTLSGDGIARTNMAARLTVMSVAAINIGDAATDVQVTYDLDGFDTFQRLTLIGCETDLSGTCQEPLAETFTTDFAAGEVKTFSVFLETPPDYALPLFPEGIRLRAQFGTCELGDGNDTCTTPDDLDLVLGGTSSAAAAPDGLTRTLPSGVYELRGRTSGDVNNQNPMTGQVYIDTESPSIDEFFGPSLPGDGDFGIGYTVNYDFAFSPSDHVFSFGGVDLGVTFGSEEPPAEPQAGGIFLLESAGTPPDFDSSDIPTTMAFGPGDLTIFWNQVFFFLSLGNFLEDGKIIAVPQVCDLKMPEIAGTPENFDALRDSVTGTFSGENGQGVPLPVTIEISWGEYVDPLLIKGEANGADISAETDPVTDPDSTFFEPNVIAMIGGTNCASLNNQANLAKAFILLFTNEVPLPPVPSPVKADGISKPASLSQSKVLLIANKFDAAGKIIEYRAIITDENRHSDTFVLKRLF